MKLEELMIQKAELELKMRELNEQIDKCKFYTAIGACETIVKSFENLDKLVPYEDLSLEVYCEECETDIDVRVEFEEIIVAIKDLKDNIEKRIKKREEV